MAEAERILKQSLGQPELKGGQWCVVELMGHVKLGGYVTEEERFGAKLGRIDVPTKAGTFETQYFGGGSIYRITPVDEGIARSVALNTQYAPIRAWQALNESAGAVPMPEDPRNFLPTPDEDQDPDDGERPEFRW